MHFTIRHLLWFTLLAAVGCWWWLPSAGDATVLGYVIDGSDEVQRFTAMDNALGYTAAKELDFAYRDVILIPADPNFEYETPPKSYLELFDVGPAALSRGSGRFVFALPFPAPPNQMDLSGNAGTRELLSVAKNAHVFQTRRRQVKFIDYGVAAGLLSLAIGSLFVGRMRKK